MMWTEKYRPETLDEIVGQPCVKKMRVKTGVLPQHALLVGPPGIGKTTTARAVARTVFGNLPEGWRSHYHEFNASKVGGIDFVRTHLTRLFSMSYEKMILLDEADRISIDAQEALRNLMENTRTTSVWFTANRPWKIHEAIVSRCVVYSFKRISDKDILRRLMHIMKKEGIHFDFGQKGETQDAQVIKYIIDKSAGDLRKAINELQRVVENNRLNPELIGDGANVDFLTQALERALAGDFVGSTKLLADAIIVDSLDTESVIMNTRDFIATIDNMKLRLELTRALSEMAYRLKFGDHLVHYESFLSYATLLSSLLGDGKNE